MPTAVRTSSGAGVINLAATRPDPQPKTTAPRPQTENGHPRRNSTSSHKRPSSAPGDDNNKPNGAHVAEAPQARGRPKKPPLMRSKSDHPSRGLHLDTSTDSSNDEQTVAAAEDFGTRHGFDGHYQSEDIISQLANVGASSCPAARSGLCARPPVPSSAPVSAQTAGPAPSPLLAGLQECCTQAVGALLARCDRKTPFACLGWSPAVDLQASHPGWSLRSRYFLIHYKPMLTLSIILRAGTCISQTRGTRQAGNRRQSRFISRIGG